MYVVVMLMFPALWWSTDIQVMIPFSCWGCTSKHYTTIDQYFIYKNLKRGHLMTVWSQYAKAIPASQ